jgi:UDP-glucuronate decarboxylase
MNTQEFSGPVNLGNPNEMTILDLAKKIIEMTESRSKIIHQPLPKDDPTLRKPDITVAKRDLDWEPRIQLEEGLARTITDFRQRLNNGEVAR